MDERKIDYRDLLDHFINAIHFDIEKYATCAMRLVLPLVNKELLIDLCSDIAEIFSEEPTLLDICSPCIVVGDIHGHILDLYRVLNYFRLPNDSQPCTNCPQVDSAAPSSTNSNSTSAKPTSNIADTTNSNAMNMTSIRAPNVSTKKNQLNSSNSAHYLFLGDIVDRGEYSLETCIIVFLLKILYPNSVHIIRGNHEFSFLCSQCGFLSQLNEVYNDTSVIVHFLRAFSQMPLSAIIDEKILCVHGGIGPNIFSVSQIRGIKRPLLDFGDPIIDCLLWSDPITNVDFFAQSERGTGCYFGAAALIDFIRSNNLSLLVRGHECVMQGVEYKFDRKLVTVFTASNYCGMMENKSGVLVIEPNNQITEKVFPPLSYMRRCFTIFRTPPKSPRKLAKPGGTNAPNSQSAVVKQMEPDMAAITNMPSRMGEKGLNLPDKHPAIVKPSLNRPAHRFSLF